jgi:hypothetical protein|nr:MAG TPA: hypothetical protein [Caudoviricetes sp.]
MELYEYIASVIKGFLVVGIVWSIIYFYTCKEKYEERARIYFRIFIILYILSPPAKIIQTIIAHLPQ